MEWMTTLGQVLWYGTRNGVAYILFASGLTLVFGIMGVVNFAHGELYMLGAMMVYTFAAVLGLNFFLSVALAIVSVGILGLIANRVVVQPFLKVKGGGLAVFLATLGLSFVLLHGSVVIWGSLVLPVDFPFPGIIHIGGVAITGAGVALVLVGTIVITGLYLFLSKATLGKKMRATAQNMGGASLVGINVLTMYDYTMVAGAALAALGAILLAQVTSTYAYMGQPMLILGFAIVVLGGMGNVKGAIIIGLVLGILEALFGYYVSLSYKPVFVYSVMIAGLLWRPQGIFARR